jgi:tetratricopeptide (TPR) repeat protein
MAAYGWLVVYDSAILSPVLVICLLLCAFLYILRLEERRKSWPWWAGAGGLLGITVATSAHASVLAPVVLLWLLCIPTFKPWRRKVVICAAFIAGCVVPVGVIAMRNWHVGHEFVPLSSNGGINFFIGNNPDAHGIFEPPDIMRSGVLTMREDATKIAESVLGRPLSSSEVSGYWFHRGLAFIRDNPADFLRLLYRKFLLFWDAQEIADVIHPVFFRDYASVLKLPMLTFGMIAPLALLGIVVSFRRNKGMFLLCLFIAAYNAFTILFFVNSRYRLPLAPFLLIPAACTVVWWIERAREKRFRAILVSIAPFVLFILLVHPPRPRVNANLGAGHNHLGGYFLDKGDTGRALREFNKALQLEPNRAEAHFNVANVHFQVQQYDVAVREYLETLRINPEFESARMNLGLTYEQMGRKEMAVELYGQAIRDFPRSTTAPRRLAAVCDSDGTRKEAIEILNDALSVDPGAPALYHALATLQMHAGRLNEAMRSALNGLQAVPDDVQLHEFVRVLDRSCSEAVIAHIRGGRLLEAQALLELELDLHPHNRDALIKLGGVFIGLNEPTQAIDVLLEAIRIVPDNYGVWRNLGVAYRLSGDNVKAEEAWRRSLRLNPSQDDLRKQLDALTN